MKVDMIKEFGVVMRKYWIFMGIKLGYCMLSYYASNDLNFGSDASGQMEWITPKGRIGLICNSTDVMEKDMHVCLTN